jgi:cytochrome c-type biogenesis protein
VKYFIVFLEGIVTFISPCLLPMLPVYVSYFLGNGPEGGRWRVLRNALGFVLGFTIIFVLMGAFAGSLGQLLIRYRTAVDIVAGIIVVILGLHFLGLFRIGILDRGGVKQSAAPQAGGLFSSLLFGMVFSIGWTPCVGAFLGSALLLASQQGSLLQGVLMLLFYSMGLGIPFVISAVLLDRLKGAFAFIKRHTLIINRISGAFLIIVGLLMAVGWLGRLLSVLSV